MEELSNCDTESDCRGKIDEINNITDEIINQVNDNDSEVKRKIEAIIDNFENSKDTSPGEPSKFSESPSNQIHKTDSSVNPALSSKIAEYCETGPFLTHLSQFIYAAQYVINQYQKKLPIFG